MKNWIFVLIVFLITSCVDQQVIDDMVKLDRAYIPTIYFLHQKDTSKAQLAYNAFYKEWQNLSKGYRKAYMEEDWSHTISLIDGHIRKSGDAFQKKDHYWALCHLENARFEWTDLRRRYNIRYYIDYMYEFQVAWDVVIETVNDPVLCWLQWNEFEKQVEDAETAWKSLMNQPLDNELFNFTDAEKEQFFLLREKTNDTWKAFKKEMDCANREYIAVTANDMTKQFIEFLNHFGQFEPTVTYIAMR